MSEFWSGWVIFLVVFNWSLVTLLFIVANRVKIPTREDGTTGHIWAHGVIREGVRRLPLWWVLMSIGSLLFGVGYLYLYPGFGNASGHLGWTSGAEVNSDLIRNRSRQADLLQKVRTASIDELSQQADVIAAADVLFQDNCAACHGPQGQGNRLIGAPNLRDDIWLYGSGDQIRVSIENGRGGVMPPFSSLTDIQAHEVAEYVFTLNGRKAEHPMFLAAGKARFQSQCAMCHGPNGDGNPQIGAPRLNDQDWLYGGDVYTIIQTVHNGRQGKMPAWKSRLSSEDIRMLMAWLQAPSDTVAKDGKP